jgi:TetR/AcrR family transcriptional regulator, transcriptional repressor for nem operon
MTEGEKSRLMIITKSAPIFNRLGYSSTSLASIMEATNFEKDGIYKHFKTKENLALEAFIYAYQLCYQKLFTPLASLSTGLEKIDGFIENFGDLPGELTGGCPIFNTGMDGGNPNLPLTPCATMRWRRRSGCGRGWTCKSATSNKPACGTVA